MFSQEVGWAFIILGGSLLILIPVTDWLKDKYFRKSKGEN